MTEPKPLWGAKAIAARLNCSTDFVYSLADDPKSPIRRVAGRIFVLESELIEWLTGTHTTPAEETRRTR